MKIFFEDEHIVIVQKPPKSLSQKDDSGDIDLCSQLERHLNHKKLFVIHRLDRPVGGIIVYAKTKTAADKMTQCIKERNFHKSYLCIACGHADPAQSTLVDYLKKKSGQNVSVAVHKITKVPRKPDLTTKPLRPFKIRESPFPSCLFNSKQVVTIKSGSRWQHTDSRFGEMPNTTQGPGDIATGHRSPFGLTDWSLSTLFQGKRYVLLTIPTIRSPGHSFNLTAVIRHPLSKLNDFKQYVYISLILSIMV